MKKILLVSCGILAFNFGVQAATAEGKVIKQNGNDLTLELENGKTLNVKTTKETRYRKAKYNKPPKTHRGAKQGDVIYFEPLAEEEDWVEVVYDPKTEEANAYLVQDVVVYDD